MTSVADRVTAVLTREFIAAHRDGVLVIAVTTVSSVVAALTARQLGAPGLAIASGFGTLDSDPRVSLSLMEAGLGTAASSKGPISDTFVALSRGMIGVAVQPAQLDATGATNLSRIGGTDAQPGVALPGSRGLPENNDAPSRVWYLLPHHSPKQLVSEVDFVSGVAPSAGRVRKLLTDLGLFLLTPGEGWRIEGLFAEVELGTVEEATGFSVGSAAEVPRLTEPSAEELAVLRDVDPDGMREIEFLGGKGLGRAAELIAAERASWLETQVPKDRSAE